MFHAINAVHALHGVAYKRHKDAVGNFNKEYVKTEIFSREIGRKIAGVEGIRHVSDYDDFYIATIEEVDGQIAVAEEFIQLVEEYCNLHSNEIKWQQVGNILHNRTKIRNASEDLGTCNMT